MQRVLIILILLMTNLFSQNFIFGFKQSFNTSNSYVINDNFVNMDNSFSTKIISGIKFKKIILKSEIKNTYNHLNKINFNPIQITYKIDITYKIKNIKFGFNHLCSHPIKSIYDNNKNHLDYSTESIYFEFYKEF